LLTTELCVLRNVPLLGDLDLTLALCRSLGSHAQLDDHTLSIETPAINKTLIAVDVGGLNRIAVLTLGPLLHRCGEVTIPAPGGDRIGPRPINFHLEGLRQMGAEIVEMDRQYRCTVSGRLHGATIKLPFPSVMATENFLIAASLAKGVTVIENAAQEPEIIDLIKLLQKMGAIIELKVDRRIVGEGVEHLHGSIT
jgi:UDP-N-acetylglucosamine 1-carboxyvinyltransferase